MKFVLASGSPRRKELLTSIVPQFEIKVSFEKEETDKTIPQEIVMDLAKHKALNVAKVCEENTIVLGADTIVVFDGKILGKPKDINDAKQMLSSLSGKIHSVFTGMCIMVNGKTDVFFDKSEVEFFSLTGKQIDDYIATGSPFDKAGAYGIQDSGFVKNIIGSYSNVMGLSLEKLAIHLKKLEENQWQI